MKNIHLGGIKIAPGVWEALAVAALLFALLLVMAYMSRQFMSWSFSGLWIGVLIGFVLTLIMEGFLLLSGKTVLTSILGWRNAPAPVQNVLDGGHKTLLDVLNVPASCSAVPK